VVKGETKGGMGALLNRGTKKRKGGMALIVREKICKKGRKRGNREKENGANLMRPEKTQSVSASRCLGKKGLGTST